MEHLVAWLVGMPSVLPGHGPREGVLASSSPLGHSSSQTLGPQLKGHLFFFIMGKQSGK